MARAADINFSFVDDKGKKSTTKVHIPNSFTFAQMIEFAQEAAQVFADVSRATLTEVSISVPIDVVSLGLLKAVASLLSDVAQKMLATFSTTVIGLFSKMFLPTINEDKVVDGSDIFDSSDVAIANFVTAVEDGLDIYGDASVVVNPTSSRGDDILYVTHMREIFRQRS